MFLFHNAIVPGSEVVRGTSDQNRQQATDRAPAEREQEIGDLQHPRSPNNDGTRRSLERLKGLVGANKAPNLPHAGGNNLDPLSMPTVGREGDRLFVNDQARQPTKQETSRAVGKGTPPVVTPRDRFADQVKATHDQRVAADRAAQQGGDVVEVGNEQEVTQNREGKSWISRKLGGLIDSYKSWKPEGFLGGLAKGVLKPFAWYGEQLAENPKTTLAITIGAAVAIPVAIASAPAWVAGGLAVLGYAAAGTFVTLGAMKALDANTAAEAGEGAGEALVGATAFLGLLSKVGGITKFFKGNPNTATSTSSAATGTAEATAAGTSAAEASAAATTAAARPPRFWQRRRIREQRIADQDERAAAALREERRQANQRTGTAGSGEQQPQARPGRQDGPPSSGSQPSSSRRNRNSGQDDRRDAPPRGGDEQEFGGRQRRRGRDNEDTGLDPNQRPGGNQAAREQSAEEIEDSLGMPPGME